MTLENMLIKNLSEWRPGTRDKLLVTDNPSGWTVQVIADRCETLGCEVWELTVSRATSQTGRTLGEWAIRTADSTLGLLEPLKVLEVDGPQNQALLRSQKPTRREGKLFYYEVRLQGTTLATVRRYQGDPEGQARREQIPYVLTHETLANVVNSLTAS